MGVWGNLVSRRVRDSVGVMRPELGRDLNFSKGTGEWDRDDSLGWGAAGTARVQAQSRPEVDGVQAVVLRATSGLGGLTSPPGAS